VRADLQRYSFRGELLTAVPVKLDDSSGSEKEQGHESRTNNVVKNAARALLFVASAQTLASLFINHAQWDAQPVVGGHEAKFRFIVAFNDTLNFITRRSAREASQVRPQGGAPLSREMNR
jgi:hypothetical protein